MVNSFLHHLVMRFFRRKTAEPAFVCLWAEKPLEIKNHCSSSCGNMPRIVSWFQWKLQPNYKFIYDIPLAPPSTFCGVLLFGITVSIKILLVLFLSYFISPFQHLCCDVAASKYNLGFTDYKKEADLKWFIVKGTEVRSRPTAHEELLILLLCLKHWARPLLALVALLQNCFWNAVIFEMQIPWHFRWNLIEQVYFSEEILRNLTA